MLEYVSMCDKIQGGDFERKRHGKLFEFESKENAFDIIKQRLSDQQICHITIHVYCIFLHFKCLVIKTEEKEGLKMHVLCMVLCM